VLGPGGVIAGSILWETKRTKSWSDGWLPKLRDDQRAAKADVAVLLTHSLPKDVERFALKDGIWVTDPRCALPLASALRFSLLALAAARRSGEGQQSKMELLYAYLTGSGFRQKIEGIVEAFTTMRSDLEVERRAFEKQWSRREKQLERVMLNTVRMWGDLQGIAGAALPEIEGLEPRSLGAGEGVAG
jgi:hypothetical protein